LEGDDLTAQLAPPFPRVSPDLQTSVEVDGHDLSSRAMRGLIASGGTVGLDVCVLSDDLGGVMPNTLGSRPVKLRVSDVRCRRSL